MLGTQVFFRDGWKRERDLLGLIRALRTVNTNFGFLRVLAIKLGGRIGQTDKWTDGRTRPVMRPTRTAAV